MSDRASKYLPLQAYLAARDGRELPMTFQQVEQVLGFALPPSARSHPAWWSNNRGTNVAVKSWRDAGWRTSRVDLSGERVTFVRDALVERTFDHAGEQVSGVADAGAPFVMDEVIKVRRESLRGGAIRMLQDYCEENGGDLGDAIVAIMNGMALERRRQLVERFKAMSPTLSDDSTEIIRAARDAR